MKRTSITVNTAATIDRIQPAVHGHFAEHLGRCVYDGLWHDETATGSGYREDVIELLAELDIPVIRWPGGCFADDYHWRDGIGPREERPRRRNLHWRQGREGRPEESNEFGTDEFLQLCERIQAEPYLAVNVGSSDPQEAADWVEYCNYDGDTDIADRRRENGHPDPYDVRYWGIGNENWGCGGRMDPEQYAREYRRFSTFVSDQSKFMLDRELELIACGYHENGWNRQFLRHLTGQTRWGSAELDALTVHFYYGEIDIESSDHGGYQDFLAGVLDIEDHITELVAAIDAVTASRDVDVIVDEWGAWHPTASRGDGLEQPGTVLDAVSAAMALNIFQNHADVISMANIAQTVNVLHCIVETNGADAWKRPTYRVFDLFKSHRGSDAVRTTVDATTLECSDTDLRVVGASASIDGQTAFLTLTNRDTRRERTVDITMAGASTWEVKKGTALFSDAAPDDGSTASSAAALDPASLSVDMDGQTATVDLPACSVAAIEFQRQ
jgi:alpha-N-arabinofuranosidase